MSELTELTVQNPVEEFLRMDRIPHIWCPGCGIGTSVNSFAHALIDAKIDTRNVAIVSGIGCTGRVAGYVKQDSFHTTHGRAIPFATGLKLANPKLNVVVYSGDGDLFAIGGNHLIHAARRNVDLKVICINNLIYAMTGGQTAPTTPGDVITSTNPYGTSIHRSTCRIWWKRRERSTSPAGRHFMFGNWRAPYRRCSPRRVSASSRYCRLAQRSISGATRWAMASTP